MNHIEISKDVKIPVLGFLEYFKFLKNKQQKRLKKQLKRAIDILIQRKVI